MRVMMLVKGDPKPAQLPSEEAIAAMTAYNEQLAKAGVLLDLNGLHPSAEGARVRFSGEKRTVTDGPFTESKELVAGYWILQVKSMDEAIEWAKRAPMDVGSEEWEGEPEIEIRRIFELDEFGDNPAVDRARELDKDLEKNRG